MFENFRLIRDKIDPAPFLDEICSVENAWGAMEGRQQKIAVQRETRSIPLRGLRKSAINGRARRDVHETRWTTGSQKFPLARKFLQETAIALNSNLARGKLVCLPAGRRVYPHIDRGEYYKLTNRYHLVLKSTHGSWLKTGNEEIRMREGELWWFDNKLMHEAMNDGEEDRIHLIFDLMPTENIATAFPHKTSTDQSIMATGA